jgi:aspartyl-tRNA(Asn)/glutamyl-tRNA(Gln) amidotransferase subunit C
MNVDKTLIEKVAQNARISLSEKEKEKFVKEFAEILEAFSVVAEAPVAAVPSVHPQPIADVMRDDVPAACLSQEEALANTKHKKDGYFKGPRAV